MTWSSRLAGAVIATFAASGIASLASAAPLAAQTLPANHSALARHREALHAERVDALHRAQLDADADGRARGDAAIARLRGPRPPALGAPSRDQLDRWRRAHERPEPEPALATLERFVDAIDLMVVPGAFQAAAGPQDADRVTVRVWAQPGVTVPGSGTLRLWWRGADGERTLARTVGFEAAAFVTPGFDLFIRAPSGAPGRWWLEPEVESDGHAARGPGVPVEGVAELDARWDALRRAPAADDASAAVLREDLELLLIAGVRADRGSTIEAALRALEGGPATAIARPFDAGVEHRAWSLGAAAAAGPIVVLVASPGAGAGGALGGERGRAWRAALSRIDATLVSVTSDAARGIALVATVERVRATWPGREIVLAPRGASAALALLGSRALLGATGGEVADHGGIWWVLARTGPGEPGAEALRGLLIGPASLGPLADDSGFALVDRPAWPFATELELPTLVADWWTARRAEGAPR